MKSVFEHIVLFAIDNFIDEVMNKLHIENLIFFIDKSG